MSSIVPPSLQPESDLAAYERVGLAVLQCDADGGSLRATPSFHRLSGLTAQALAGQTLAGLLVPLQPTSGGKPSVTAGRPFPAQPMGIVSATGRVLSCRVAGHAAAGGGLWLTVHELAEPQSSAEPIRSLDQVHLGLVTGLAGVGIWRRDLATDLLQYNDQVFGMLGQARQDQGVRLTQVLPLIHPDDLAEAEAARTRVLAGEQCGDLITRYRHADGSWRRILTRRTLECDRHGEPVAIIGVALDLTDRFEQAERELELARRLELASSAAGVAIWTYSPVTRQAQWNAQMYTLHGLPAADRVPDLVSYVQRFIHSDDRAPVQEGLDTLMARRQGMVEVELRIVRGDGVLRRVSTRTTVENKSGEALVFGVMLDVTDSHAARQRLNQASERALLVAQGAGIGTWEMNFDTGEALWDEQMWRLRGLPPQPKALTYPERMALVHPDDRDKLDREYQRVLSREDSTHTEFRILLPDGQQRWLVSRSIAVAEDGARSKRRIGINWDITDARNAESARQEKLLAQRESQAKSRFLARMSHELRTPLNAVLGFTQLLLSETASADPAQQRLRVEHIHAAGEHLLSLINSVLDLSSMESGELPLNLQAVPLRPLLDRLVPLVEKLSHDHGVSLQFGSLEVTPWADPMRLGQVLLNLLSNAIKYNRPDGTVHVQSLLRDGLAVIQVRDSGRGMTPQQLQHLFEPFNRLGLEREGIAGIGIGLTIVKATTERMGGSVHVDCSSGVGCVFELRLTDARATLDRIEAAPAGARPAGSAMAPHAGTGGGRVLYIEDNAVNVMIVSELVAQRKDLTLRSASTGAEGVELARSWQPNLVLLDMQLPDFDGQEVRRRLRADGATAHIPCIALSANAMPEDIQQALQAGFADYWTKPLDFPAFMTALEARFGPAPAA